jgi:hypothetical protein
MDVSGRRVDEPTAVLDARADRILAARATDALRTAIGQAP